ncbi:MAG: glycosyltransferase family 2 protein [Bacteroidetes bacterium]|nr:glycosyltransferase family 2 protein [Bacteroidota bacterium]
MKKVAVVIPAYNEEKSIASVVSEINKLKVEGFDFTPIIVNDASKDKTAKIASKLDCVFIDLTVNLGIGGTVQTGFIYAFHNGFDYAMQVDGDGQHPPTEIPKLVTVIKDNNYDVVIGSRFIDKTGFQSSYMRRFGINYLKFIIRFYTGLKITDSTSGFRLLNLSALKVVNGYYPDEYPEPESIILFHKKRLKIKEVAVLMDERQGGESSIRAFNTLYYMVKVSLAIFYTFIRIKQKSK